MEGANRHSGTEFGVTQKVHKQPEQNNNTRAEMATRWPDWTFTAGPLGGFREVINPAKQSIMIDPDAWPQGAEFARAHCLAHLDLGHHLLTEDRFTAQHERDASCLAEIRLDVGDLADTEKPSKEEPHGACARPLDRQGPAGQARQADPDQGSALG